MDLGLLAQIGEFLGGVGVLITLIYLSIQIRQNTKSQRDASRLATTRSLTDWYSIIMQDAELNRIWNAGHAQELELESEDCRRFEWMLAAISSRIQEIHTQYLAGLIEEDVWFEHRDLLVSSLQNPLVDGWWASGTTPFTKEFRRAIQEANDGTVTWANKPNDPSAREQPHKTPNE